MDDQFGGRTDDDLFADEFEPVENSDHHQADLSPAAAAAAIPAPAPVSTAVEPEAPTAAASSYNPQPAASVPTTTSSSSNAPATDGPRGLSQSIHAQQPPPASTPRGPRNHRSNHPSANNHSNKRVAANASPGPSSPSTNHAPPNQQQQPSQAPSRPQGPRNGAHQNNAARMSSGANPRTKLTEHELAEKMEKMKLLNAEKTKQFEQAEKDRESHNIALEKANEDAKRRRAEEAERKQREAVDRRQMEDERHRNRERKLKALGARPGGSWDEGKEERMLEEDRKRGGYNFRGANGGVRGPSSSSRGEPGLSGSRFSAPTGDMDFMSGRGGARGRGRGGRGRGGRGGYSSRDELNGSPAHQGGSSSAPPKEAVLVPEDFPALPTSTAPKPKAAEAVAKVELASPMSPVGKWDDEMEAQDAQKASVDLALKDTTS